MSAFIDLTGQRFGMLVALKFLRFTNHRAYYLFQCDCGSEPFERMAQQVKVPGVHQKCRPCDLAERIKAKHLHGGFRSRLYGIWIGARGRCRNPRDKVFKDYGGRGITFWSGWDDFAVFRDWALANGYADELEIDRINNDVGYHPDNCRWVDRKMQNRNTRRNKLFEYQGKLRSIPEIAEMIGMHVSTLRGRLAGQGMTPDEAATKAMRR